MRERNDSGMSATSVLIHGTNGQIRERNTYGKDSYPPKG